MVDGMNVSNSYSAYEPPKGNPATARSAITATTQDLAYSDVGRSGIGEDVSLELARQNIQFAQQLKTSLANVSGDLQAQFMEIAKPLFAQTQSLQKLVNEDVGQTRIDFLTRTFQIASQSMKMSQFSLNTTA